MSQSNTKQSNHRAVQASHMKIEMKIFRMSGMYRQRYDIIRSIHPVFICNYCPDNTLGPHIAHFNQRMHRQSSPQVQVEVYCPADHTPPLPISLNPPQETAVAPVIYHVHCVTLPSTDPPPYLSSFLSLHTGLPLSLLRELIEFGAIYMRLGEVDAQTSPRASRVRADRPLSVGVCMYARIYANPKRHIPYRPLRILYEDDAGLLVVDKPPGLPVAASADNLPECVTALTGAFVCHRLDIGTEGVLLLARTPHVVRSINNALAEGRKTYRVLSEDQPVQGVITHWYNKKATHGRGKVKCQMLAKRGVANEKPHGQGWVEAELVVEQIKQRKMKGKKAFESQVHLITGRTHQIRLQFAAIGCAVWGDVKYQTVNGKACETPGDLYLGPDAKLLALCAAKVEITWQERKMEFVAAPTWWDET